MTMTAYQCLFFPHSHRLFAYHCAPVNILKAIFSVVHSFRLCEMLATIKCFIICGSNARKERKIET